MLEYRITILILINLFGLLTEYLSEEQIMRKAKNTWELCPVSVPHMYLSFLPKGYLVSDFVWALSFSSGRTSPQS